MDKIPEFTEDLNIISRLSDSPNTGDMLDAQELKAKFDKAGLSIQKFMNQILIPAINNFKPEGNSGAEIEILIFGVSDAFRIYDAIMSGRPVYCLYENQYYLPLISWNEETETAVFSNSFIQCQSVAGEWSGNPVTEESIEPEVFVGTARTTVTEFYEAFSSGKPCFLMKAIAGSGITMWVAYSCGASIAYFYRIAPDGSVEYGSLDNSGMFTYEIAGTSGSSDSNVFIGNNDTTLAEFKSAYDSGKTCFLRRRNPSGAVTYTAYNVNSTYAFFFAINTTGAIVYAYLDSNNLFTVQERKHVTTIDQNSTDDQIPTAKAVYDAVKSKLDSTELPSAVNDALAQAKESGEFNGPQGPQGEKGDTGAQGPQGEDGASGYTPIKGVDYYTDSEQSEFSEYIAAELAKRGQLKPEFVNSIEECTDTTKLYVLPDGYIYAYMLTEVAGKGYTNLVPTSIDADGSTYNGTGYKDDARLSSSGDVSGTAQAGSVVTGFIPVKNTDVIRIKGAVWLRDQISTGHFYLSFYDSGKSLLGVTSASGQANNPASAAIVYDETTGVTTFDVNEGSAFGNTVASAAYFRINAYGKGTDLIVTVNEEIEEASTTISYAWANTGHAFVPADYEDRIVALEEESAENKEAVAELKQQVDDILDGTTEIAASTKFDPTVYGLPVLYLTGDTTPIAVSKDNKVTLDYVYGERSGTCTLKGQGATSYKTAQELVNAGKKGKFNYTIKFDTAFEAKEGWGAQQKYCLKANFIDTTHSRNICSCKLWGMIVKSRSTVPAELADLPNGGAIDGFPIVIMLNGEFHGLYTWNIPKDGWMFGLVEDTAKTQAIVGADDHTSATQFKDASMTGFEVEFVSDEDNAAWAETSLTRLISAVMNSDGSDLDTTVAQYLDWDSCIDHFIHTVVDKATDCVDKNYLLVTFDGVKWYMSAYDRDSIHGLNWSASGTTRPVSNISFVECAETMKVYELIKRFKTNALKARYKELRGDILSESRIMQVFENFAWAIPSPVMIEDVKLYPTIKGSGVNTIDQIGRFVRQRLETTDAWIDQL